MASLSVIIITKNEEENIRGCLESVRFSDEIVVVDSESTDNTIEICKEFTDKILVTDWPGYGAQKQRALAMATKDWVLTIDADERVTQELQEEISRTLATTHFDAFEIHFRSQYCGKTIRFGDWWNDKQVVLFRRTKGHFPTLKVHEKLHIEGKIGKMKGLIRHLAFQNLNRVLTKMNAYSTWSAEQKFSRGKKATLWTALSHSFWTFLRGYIVRLGFLDGREGFLLAVSNAEGTFYKYMKLAYLSKTPL
jgi:glycosyltransferase involved in cell wall biosynthesis